MTTVTGTAVGGSAPSATSIITTTLANYNTPGGLTNRVVTGLMTTLPTVLAPSVGGIWTNLSPSTVAPTGEWSGNLTLTPAPDTGIRVNFPTNLVGGNPSVRFGPANWGAVGTGFYYQRMRVRYAANWTLSGNIFVQWMTFLFNVANVPTDTTWIGGRVGASGTGGGYVVTTPQWGDGTSATLPGTWVGTIDFANIGDIGRNQWFYIEMYAQPETTSGAGNGQYDLWITDSTATALLGHYHQNSVTWIKGAAQDLKWQGVLFNSVYGGGANSPSVATFIDFDDIVIATK